MLAILSALLVIATAANFVMAWRCDVMRRKLLEKSDELDAMLKAARWTLQTPRHRFDLPLERRDAAREFQS